MDAEIVIPRRLWNRLRSHLLIDKEESRKGKVDEQLAFLLAGKSVDSKRVRLLVREILPAHSENLEYQSGIGVAPKQDFVIKALNRCQAEGWQLIEVHSHPFDSSPSTTFSGIDWGNDRRKMPALSTLSTEPFLHATMVMGRNSADAHFYDSVTREIKPVSRIVIIGVENSGSRNALERVPTTSGNMEHEYGASGEVKHQRQQAVLGTDGQRALTQSTIAVIGLGGLGSFVTLELAHLGVGRLILIDPDVIEVSNLNRLLGAGMAENGRRKVEFYKDVASGVSPATEVVPVGASILQEDALSRAKEADLLVGCVDNHGARLILNQLAIRYLLPLVDGGAGITLERYHLNLAEQ
ncbi:ThiF family adenylyltransferase [Streptomyces sp. NPDC015139]|uniref:ThiF family adenylyltransferase n=1 Tax=Streptomyces sp. NPDC015139 TaxID=3364942 RepID=UPI00370077CF